MPAEFEAYVGIRPFEKHEHKIFFGRKREVSDLVSLIIAHPAVLLYAQSGAGKTSLLNAGLIPCLSGEGLEVLPVARVQGLIPKGIRLETVSNPYVFNSLTSWLEKRDSACDSVELSQVSLEGFLCSFCRTSLESFLKERPRLKDDEGNPLPRVLIFDQFEELFSSYPERWADRKDFLTQIGKLLAHDSSLRVLFAMREDYIAQLDPYVSLLPENLRARLHLECLRRHAAQEAVEGPLGAFAELTGSPVEDAKAVAEKLVERLLMNRIETAPGKIEEVPGEFVEPVQLQVVCQRLWKEYRDSGLRKIPETLPDVDDVLFSYYEESIALVAGMNGVSEEALRDWFGEKLITKLGTRGVVFREPEQTAGIPNSAVDFLSDKRHVIRGEWRAGARWYELAHDRFIEPIRKSNEAWRRRWRAAHRNPLTHAASNWQRLNLDEGCLFGGARLDEAKEWARKNPSEVSELERQFLDASTALRERQAREKEREARRLRWAVSGLAVLLLAMIGLTIFAFRQREEAQRQQHIALSRELALSALSQLTNDPELGLLLATEAVSATHTVEAEDALRQALIGSHVRVVLRDHTAKVNTAAFSPDGSLIVTSSEDKTARVWEAATGKVVTVLGGHADAVKSAVFSPDGKRVATASWDHSARLWDIATKQVETVLQGHEGWVTDVAFSPDSRFVVTASEDKTARVWEAATGHERASLLHNGAVLSAAFSPDGQFVVTASKDKTARVWEATTGRVITLTHDGPVLSAAFSPDGKSVATASGDKTARVWEVATGRELARLVHDGPVFSVAYSPDGTSVVTACDDGIARVWEVATGKSVDELGGPAGGVISAVFSPDGKLVVTGSTDGTARVWEVATGRSLAELRGHADIVTCVAFSSNGQWVATASNDATARVWDAVAGQTAIESYEHTGEVNSATFSSDGQWVATASNDGTARVWEIATGRVISLTHDGPVFSAAFNSDAKSVVTASGDKTARVWEVATGRVISLTHDEPVFSAAFSSDDKFVVTASGDRTARVWEAATGRVIILTHDGPVFSAAFSSDAKLVVTASEDRTAQIWEAATGKSMAKLRGHAGRVNSAVFSPDGKFVVTASEDGTARLWEAATGKSIAELRGHAGSVNSATFSPDSQFVVTASADGLARVWKAATGKSVADLRGHAGGVNSAVFSPDSKFIVTASADGAARVWEAGTGRGVAELRGHTGGVMSAAFSPDGRLVVTASMDKTARIYPCEVCGSIDELLALALGRVTRLLTCPERNKYLHENIPCPTPAPNHSLPR